MSENMKQNGAIRPTVAEGSAAPAKPQPNDPVEYVIDGIRLEIPAALDAGVRRAIEAARRPLPAEMTLTQAAEYLDVSRSFVVKLIKRDELPCRLVGKRRRIPSDALRKYREEMLRKASRDADEMVRLNQEMGLYDLEGPPPKAP